MFDVFCPGCARTVLLGLRSVEGLRHTGGGIEVSWRCHHGHRGTVVGGAGHGWADRLDVGEAV